MYMDMADFSKFGFHRIIRYRGIFDFDGFYKYVVKWIKDHDFDYYEPKVLDKPPYKIYKMMGRKKVSFFAMFMVLPEIWIWEAKPVEIIKDGQKKVLTEARMKFVVNGGIILDYDGDFEKSEGQKKMEKFLVDKILYHEVLLKYFDYMDYYLYDFMTDIKRYLEMETATNAY
ncbi:MAG: hypothetical protein HGA85_01960 [Nanoarchaeota archaeon]|nr:hypothetical protein [Nanoarchaeota archaeon]